MSKETIINTSIDEVNDVIDFYINAFNRISQDLSDAIYREIVPTGMGKYDNADIAYYSRIRREIDILLAEVGMNQFYNDMIEKGYQEIYESQAKMYDKLYDTVEEPFRNILPITNQEIQGIKQIDFSKFNVGNERLKQVVVDVIRGAQTRTQAANTMRESIDIGYRQYIRTWVDTSMSAFTREVNNIYAKEADIKYFEYVGANDKKTRPFCKSHIGEIRTMSEWKALKNPSKLPTFPYLGGYRCRHALIAVNPKIYKEKFGIDIDKVRKNQ